MPVLLVLAGVLAVLWFKFIGSPAAGGDYSNGGEAGAAWGPVSLPFSLPYDVDALAVQYAGKYGLDPDVVRAQIWRESRGVQWNPDGTVLKSKAGALGVMQLMPKTAAGLGVDPLQLESNIDGGTRYLADLLAQFGSYDKALAGYNWGPGRVSRWGDSWASHAPAETVNYVQNIFSDLGWSSDSVSGAEGFNNA